MGDGELEFSHEELFPSINMGELPTNCSMDSLFGRFDEILKDTHACTHEHICNPMGPDASHTHTCLHVHTKILPAPSDQDKASADDTTESRENKPKKRSPGNREAVRKYREKKKARAASLEDEVARLNSLNQQLMKRLQGQVALEAENARLKCLLVDIRGRIEGEIGSFPYRKSVRSAGNSLQNIAHKSSHRAYAMDTCNMTMQCDDLVCCFHPTVGQSGENKSLHNGQEIGGCGFKNFQCLENQNTGLQELPGCEFGNAVSTGD